MSDYHNDRPRILFLTVGDRNWASSRMRSYWTADIMPEADVMQFSPDSVIPDDYDVYVWMKTADTVTMRRHAALGKLSFVETCDPNWWFQPNQIREIVDIVTAVVGANQPSLDDLLKWYGTDKRAYVIPDRLNLDHFPIVRQHDNVDPVRLIWYGVANNRVAMFGIIPVLERLAANGVKFEFTICDNAPNAQFIQTDKFQVYNTQWALDTENATIAAHDIAVLPPYPGPWGPLKTNNKVLTAWACGLPAVDGHDYYQLYDLCTRANRRGYHAHKAYDTLVSEYTTDKTVDDWRRIIATEMELRK